LQILYTTLAIIFYLCAEAIQTDSPFRAAVTHNS